MNNDENKEFLVRYSTSFKKDLKKISKQSEKVEKVTAAIKILREKGVDGIPAEMKPHYLKGKYKGCLECHIEGDLPPAGASLQLVPNSKFTIHNSSRTI
ncbi:type II toxin-antitoxin system YafQ family toxin [Capnocytophaga sputigena]|uniref:type II toxin-antitoxin system YafQ family toxin n=1 Tax=Capnocytophaga sputigena TaxID=1019 RepID=UPI0028E34808|nr:type II toxin-antitoxin system YafQ family toxin [Capnocytophaga sputigena]